jgi:hypothetical protein
VKHFIYLLKNYAPFDKKKMWRHVLPMCPFSFLQKIRKIAWSKGDNSSELSNFDAIVKKKMLTADRRKRKREEGRSSLMPKPNEILQKRGMVPRYSIFL